MPKNLGTISDPKDLITLEYLEKYYLPLSKTPKIIVGTTLPNSGTSSISIPTNILDKGNMLVYQNGLLLTEDTHYSIGTNVINLIGYTAQEGDIFTFLYIG